MPYSKTASMQGVMQWRRCHILGSLQNQLNSLSEISNIMYNIRMSKGAIVLLHVLHVMSALRRQTAAFNSFCFPLLAPTILPTLPPSLHPAGPPSQIPHVDGEIR